MGKQKYNPKDLNRKKSFYVVVFADKSIDISTTNIKDAEGYVDYYDRKVLILAKDKSKYAHLDDKEINSGSVMSLTKASIRLIKDNDTDLLEMFASFENKLRKSLFIIDGYDLTKDEVEFLLQLKNSNNEVDVVVSRDIMKVSKEEIDEIDYVRYHYNNVAFENLPQLSAVYDFNPNEPKSIVLIIGQDIVHSRISELQKLNESLPDEEKLDKNELLEEIKYCITIDFKTGKYGNCSKEAIEKSGRKVLSLLGIDQQYPEQFEAMIAELINNDQ